LGLAVAILVEELVLVFWRGGGWGASPHHNWRFGLLGFWTCGRLVFWGGGRWEASGGIITGLQNFHKSSAEWDWQRA